MIDSCARRFRAVAGCVVLIAALFGVVGARAATAGANDIHTIAGTGVSGNSGDGDQSTEACIDRPRSVLVTADGGYIFAEPYINLVRRVASDGTVSTVAGNGAKGFGGDGGPATQARINFVHSASPTSDGGFLLADTEQPHPQGVPQRRHTGNRHGIQQRGDGHRVFRCDACLT